MGTPRRPRRKYTRPTHPWIMERIVQEKEICVKYGLKTKTELWKAQSKLGRIRDQAKKLLDMTGEKAEQERREHMAKLNMWGISAKSMDDILALDVNALLERRLQTIVFRKGLASTPNQARQFIVHNHVYVGDHRVGVPSYIVLAGEEDKVRVTDEIIKVTQSVREEVKEAC